MQTTAFNPSVCLPQYRYSQGDIIQCLPNVLYFCLEGIVLLRTLHVSGDEGMLELITPGLVFGLPLVSVSMTAVALSEVRLKAIDLLYLKRSPQLAQQLVYPLIDGLRSSHAFLAVSNQRRVHERFSAFLSLLAKQVGHRTEQGMLIDIRLTHQQIANAIGATRVTVTRLINDYRHRGLVKTDFQQILIPDLDRLQNFYPPAELVPVQSQDKPG
ncbi:MAG: Crp/Fnr family transcriptional regulator [Gemmatimonadaceae bacterium]|nr:Crp/Fnr family transcriptional regulator [Gloeobacterales cyanobacterium ES-bin-141]